MNLFCFLRFRQKYYFFKLISEMRLSRVQKRIWFCMFFLFHWMVYRIKWNFPDFIALSLWSILWKCKQRLWMNCFFFSNITKLWFESHQLVIVNSWKIHNVTKHPPQWLKPWEFVNICNCKEMHQKLPFIHTKLTFHFTIEKPKWDQIEIDKFMIKAPQTINENHKNSLNKITK